MMDTKDRNVRCKRCGWPNEANQDACVKCHAPLVADDVERFKNSKQPIFLDNGMSSPHRMMPRQYKLGPFPHKIRFNRIREEGNPDFKIRKTGSQTVSKQDVERVMMRIQSHKFDGYSEVSDYLCPICGNYLTIIEAPRMCGDDYVSQCPICQNRFTFGGTYFIGYHLTSLESLSPDSNKLANEAMFKRSKVITKNMGKTICRLQDMILIMKDLETEFQVTDAMELL